MDRIISGPKQRVPVAPQNADLLPQKSKKKQKKNENHFLAKRGPTMLNFSMHCPFFSYTLKHDKASVLDNWIFYVFSGRESCGSGNMHSWVDCGGA